MTQITAVKALISNIPSMISLFATRLQAKVKNEPGHTKITVKNVRRGDKFP
jgi:hypothetical protein